MRRRSDRISREAFGLSRLLQDATVCQTCKKFTMAVNLNLLAGKRGFSPEPISPEKHCTCEGGIAHQFRDRDTVIVLEANPSLPVA